MIVHCGIAISYAFPNLVNFLEVSNTLAARVQEQTDTGYPTL